MQGKCGGLTKKESCNEIAREVVKVGGRNDILGLGLGQLGIGECLLLISGKMV